VNDFILEIRYDTSDTALDEMIQSRLFVTESSGSSGIDGGLEAYFASAAERDEALEALASLPVALRALERERIDWLEKYQQSLVPLFIGERFIVAPDASLISADRGRLPLVVPQEQAFGTGSHETTALCIELLENLPLEGKRGLDVGSGSGILALAMLRLGVARAVAFDNDPDAFAALNENRARNDVAPSRMPVFIGTLAALRGGSFDVVTMNILPEVIIEVLPEAVRHMRDAMIVSGILVERRDEVLAAAAGCGLRLARGKTRGEWWAGELRRE
jgi:ribosomal protein L11 methyltransferase